MLGINLCKHCKDDPVTWGGIAGALACGLSFQESDVSSESCSPSWKRTLGNVADLVLWRECDTSLPGPVPYCAFTSNPTFILRLYLLI